MTEHARLRLDRIVDGCCRVSARNPYCRTRYPAHGAERLRIRTHWRPARHRHPTVPNGKHGGIQRRRGPDPSRTLVVYFSRAGENHWYGGRRLLRLGNTRLLVDMISARIECDTYEIVATDPYPRAYEPTVNRNVEEMRADDRPAIAKPLPDLARYRNVLIGSPVWASQAPMIMSTFIEGVDLRGVRVLPFVTFAVSGMAGIDTHYRSVLAGTDVAEGLAIQGEEVAAGGKALDAWLRSNGLLTA